jgi:hypothetical protein
VPKRPDGEIGKHSRLKICRPQGLAGSIPARGTIDAAADDLRRDCNPQKTGILSRFFYTFTSWAWREVASGGASKVTWNDETFAPVGFDINAKGAGRMNLAHPVRQAVLVGRVSNQVDDLGLAGLLVAVEYQQQARL